MRFGIFADVHYGLKNEGDRFCPLGREKLKLVLSRLKDCDFILNMGDLINGSADFETTSKLLEDLREVMAGYPVIHVIGNHDAFHLNKSQIAGPVQSDLGAVGCFDRDGTRFIILDCNFYSDETTYDLTHGDWTDTICPSAQLSWLRKKLNECENAVVVLHHTLVNLYGDSAVSLSDPHMVRNSHEIRDIIESSGKVKYVISGHNHAGGSVLHNGILYYTAPAVCSYNNIFFATASLHDKEISFCPKMLQF